ncbi:unnamed protein product [Linum trigynum]|uniref:Uncharacterized protein n=1 Tax=Linum trigynum TaxID=586398 RepID=A0AAV2G033_9ROSI
MHPHPTIRIPSSLSSLDPSLIVVLAAVDYYSMCRRELEWRSGVATRIFSLPSFIISPIAPEPPPNPLICPGTGAMLALIGGAGRSDKKQRKGRWSKLLRVHLSCERSRRFGA